jgi:AcrR family transcriptional regulator
MKDLTANDVYWWRSLDDRVLDTRGKILQAAYQEIHFQGFQSASLTNILARVNVTKGALYHHFANKTELGYAVVDEVIAERIHLSFIKPIQFFENPVDGFIELIRSSGSVFSIIDIELGCPLTNLAQEMAPIDEGFRIRLVHIYGQWYRAIAEAMVQAKQANQIIDAVDPDQLAVTLVATMEGALSAAKVAQSLDKLQLCVEGLIQYLELIRK